MSKMRVYNGFNLEATLLNELIGENSDDRLLGGILRVGFVNHTSHYFGSSGLYMGNDVSFNYSGLKQFSAQGITDMISKFSDLVNSNGGDTTSDTTSTTSTASDTTSTASDTTSEAADTSNAPAANARSFNSFAIKIPDSESGAKFKLIALKNTFLDDEKFFILTDTNEPLSISVNPDWKAVDVGFKVESTDYDNFEALKQAYDATLTNAADGNLGVLAIRPASQDPRTKDKVFQHREVLNINSRPHLGYSMDIMNNAAGGGLKFFVDIGPTVGYSLYANSVVDLVAQATAASTAAADTTTSTASTDTTTSTTPTVEKDPHALVDVDGKMKFKVTGLTGGDIEKEVTLDMKKLAEIKAMEDSGIEPYAHYLSLGGGIGAGLHYDFNDVIGVSMHIKYALNGMFNISGFNKIQINLRGKIIGYKFLAEELLDPTANVVSYVGNDLVKKIIELQTGSKYMYDNTLSLGSIPASSTVSIYKDNGSSVVVKTNHVINKLPFIKINAATLDISTVQDTVGAFITKFAAYYNKKHDIKIGDASISLSQANPYTLNNWGFIHPTESIHFAPSQANPNTLNNWGFTPPSTNTIYSDNLATHTIANGRLYGNNYLVGSTPDTPSTETARQNMVAYMYSSSSVDLDPTAISDVKKLAISQGFLDNVKSIIEKTINDQAIKATPTGSLEFSIFPSPLPLPDSTNLAIGDDKGVQNNSAKLTHTLSISVGFSYMAN